MMMLLAPLTMKAETKVCEPATQASESRTQNEPREATRLLRDVESDAMQVKDHADELRIFAMNKDLTWHAHASELEQIKEEVNDIGAKICRLEAIRGIATQPEQMAIDRTIAVAREMAANTSGAFNYLNQNIELLRGGRYMQYSGNLSKEGRELSHVIRDAERLSNAQRIEQKLEGAETNSGL
jgi:hypothetical protein